MASYDGANIFGAAVRIRHIPRAGAEQINSFFGITGTQAIYGGGRGRIFEVQGLFLAPNPLAIRAIEAALLSYADGVPRVLVDTYGTAWPNVIFKGEYQPGDLAFTADGYAQPYKAVFHGLT
jgi:hypothetical protein